MWSEEIFIFAFRLCLPLVRVVKCRFWACTEILPCAVRAIFCSLKFKFPFELLTGILSSSRSRRMVAKFERETEKHSPFDCYYELFFLLYLYWIEILSMFVCLAKCAVFSDHHSNNIITEATPFSFYFKSSFAYWSITTTIAEKKWICGEQFLFICGIFRRREKLKEMLQISTVLNCIIVP